MEGKIAEGETMCKIKVWTRGLIEEKFLFEEPPQKGVFSFVMEIVQIICQFGAYCVSFLHV